MSTPCICRFAFLKTFDDMNRGHTKHVMIYRLTQRCMMGEHETANHTSMTKDEHIDQTHRYHMVGGGFGAATPVCVSLLYVRCGAYLFLACVFQIE